MLKINQFLKNKATNIAVTKLINANNALQINHVSKYTKKNTQKMKKHTKLALNKKHRLVFDNNLLNLQPSLLPLQVIHIQPFIFYINFRPGSCQMRIIRRRRIANRPIAPRKHVAQIIRQLLDVVFAEVQIVPERAILRRLGNALDAGVRD